MRKASTQAGKGTSSLLPAIDRANMAGIIDSFKKVNKKVPYR
jgi:hypothetical protein